MSKKAQKNQKTAASTEKIKYLSELRIIQTNLVYLCGLSKKFANKELLSKYEYLGQYGQIKSIIINKFSNSGDFENNAYISYNNVYEASIAILALDQYEIDGVVFKAFYGSSKYCLNFLNGKKCPNKNCLYLHQFSENLSFHKDEKFFLDYKNLALKYVSSNIKIYDFSKKNTKKTLFPSISHALTEYETMFAEISDEKNMDKISIKPLKSWKDEKKAQGNKKITYENEWNEKDNFFDSDKKNDEEISTTTADYEIKSQANGEIVPLKNVELFVKRKEPNYFQYQSNNSKSIIDLILNEEDKEIDNFDKNYLILNKEELDELQNKWDEEIFYDILNFIRFLQNPLEYSYFTTSFVVYKCDEKAQVIDYWLQTEKNIIKKLDIHKNIMLEKFKEHNFFKELISFDNNCQKIFQQHLNIIEKIHKNLNNINQGLQGPIEENFKTITVIQEEESLKLNISNPNQNENEKPMETNRDHESLAINNKKNISTPIKELKNKENLNNDEFFEEKIVSRKNKKNSNNQIFHEAPSKFTKEMEENKKKASGNSQNIFTLISEHKDFSSSENFSTPSDKKKNNRLETNNFIADEERLNYRENTKISSVSQKLDFVDLKNNEKIKKDLKKKQKKNKKKKNSSLETNEKKKIDLKKEKEEEDKFYKFIENFARNNDENVPPVPTHKSLNFCFLNYKIVLEENNNKKTNSMQQFIESPENYFLQSHSIKIIVRNLNLKKANEIFVDDSRNLSELSESIKMHLLKSMKIKAANFPLEESS